MKQTTRLGIVLNLIGVAVLALGGYSPAGNDNLVTQTIKIGHQQIKNVPLLSALGGLVLICGIILIIVGVNSK